MRRDIRRYTGPVDRGRRVYRHTGREILGEPEWIAAQIARALHGARST